MIHQKLDLKKREVVGNDVRKLRRDGFIPGVIYGNKNKQPENVQIEYNYFLKTYRGAGKTHVLDIDLGSEKIPCLIHKIDLDPVRNKIIHFDLLEVNLKQEVTASVPLEIVGEAIGVKKNKLILSTELSEFKVSALPDNVPESIKIDVTKLEDIGDSIKVADLEKSDKYKIENDEHDTIAVLVSQTEEKEEASSDPVADLIEESEKKSEENNK